MKDFFRGKLSIFSSKSQIEKVANSSIILGDGTFYSAPHPFLQLYTIHAQCSGKMLQLIFFLLTNISVNTYKKMFEEFSLILQENQFDFNPQTFLIDFEQGAKQAFLDVFPNGNIKHYLFHFGQSLWRKLQNICLQQTLQYKIALWFFALPLVPKDKIYDIWLENIMADAPFELFFIFCPITTLVWIYQLTHGVPKV